MKQKYSCVFLQSLKDLIQTVPEENLLLRFLPRQDKYQLSPLNCTLGHEYGFAFVPPPPSLPHPDICYYGFAKHELEPDRREHSTITHKLISIR